MAICNVIDKNGYLVVNTKGLVRVGRIVEVVFYLEKLRSQSLRFIEWF